MPRWLVKKNRLKKQQEAKNKQWSAIIIIVSNNSKAKKLYANGFCFRGVVKVEEKYWKAKQGLVCIRYCKIEHKRQGNYSDKRERCLLWAEPH